MYCVKTRHGSIVKSKLLAIGSFNCSKNLDFGKNTTCIRYIISRNRTRNFICYGYWLHRSLLGAGAGFKGSTTKTAHIFRVGFGGGGRTRRVPPLKLKKILFFGIKSWFFTRNTPKMFAPPSARRNFFNCAPPPNLKSWIRPLYCIYTSNFNPIYEWVTNTA